MQTTMSASGFCHNEAESLHLRYGLDVALSTLSPTRYLIEPKTRSLVERLFSFQGGNFTHYTYRACPGAPLA